ncbi:MAG: extracellular solute-binding protein [Bacilli bacterium]|nr:extracellular solute-binding protein [Bacilli bacterium]
MKHIKKGLIGALSLLMLTGCSGGSEANNDKSTLNIILYDAGWGREWLDDVITKWEKENEGYKVNLTAKYEVKTLINRHLSSKNNPDDLYITTDGGWRNYAYQGKFAPLDDLMSETVDGVTVEEKVNDEFKPSLKMNVKGEEHVYRLPWTSGFGGIFYNAKMFEENGWKVPETTAELTALVKQILENPVEVKGDDAMSVKPFVYTGENTDYFDYTIFNWWMQLAGYDKVTDFYKYESAENFNWQNKDSAYSSLKTVVDYWKSLFGDITIQTTDDNGNPVNDQASSYINGSLSYSNHDAQQDFFNGKAAMIFDGDWIYNETLKYGTKPEGFEMKLMKTPTFEGAKDTDVSYVIGSDQYIAVPASSKKQDLAKSFIKMMISNESLSNFTNKSHGFLAYKNTDPSSIDTTNPYIKSYLDVRNSVKKTTTDDSKAEIYLNGYISNAWVASSNRPFLGLLQQSSKTVESSFDTIYKAAQDSFSRA